jgi:nucleoside-diphosphate-sugar epimerase
MKVFLAGATGAIGVPLTRKLIEHGHEVIGLTTQEANVARLLAQGATPVVADALDRDALLRACHGMTADAIVHELTALKKPPRTNHGMDRTDELRTLGTANLVAAAGVLGARRFVTQSMFLGYGYRGHGPNLLDEETPFGVVDGRRGARHVRAMGENERLAFTMPEGIALRYGLFYSGDPAAVHGLLMKRSLPVARGGLLAWVHHLDAVEATVAALEQGRPGNAYNIVDDEPATWTEVYTAMADAMGTPRPRRVPRFVFRLMAPLIASFAVDTSIRLSNAKAKRELGWRPGYRTYREGVSAIAAALEPACTPAGKGR